MREVTEKEVKNRLAFDNPWWSKQGGIDSEIREWPKRAYFDAFSNLVREKSVRRAVVLMGPRRVGKTVMIQQTVQHLIDQGAAPKSVLYVSLDTPTYFGLPLERLLQLFQEHHKHHRKSELYVFFDEIQYLKDWEIHLKSLVDSYPSVQFVASGSAAAALRLKSRESGAGRFTDFLLPPLTFAEFLRFKNLEDSLFEITVHNGKEFWHPKDITALNDEFVNYINYGGFPEAVFSERVRNNIERFIGNDIIDKVLLRDLPSLYGISDTQELNHLFTTIAYNTGNEVSLDGLSQSSGVAKNTLKKYMEYLEAAFLIRRVNRVDQNARRFKRAVTFKVYLTNPCIRAALFGPVEAGSEAMGLIAETAFLCQWMHSWVINDTFYARWHGGEIDIVCLSLTDQRPLWVYEVKWSDRPVKHSNELRAVISFAKKHHLSQIHVLTKTRFARAEVSGIEITFLPVSYWCFTLNKIWVDEPLVAGEHPRPDFLSRLF